MNTNSLHEFLTSLISDGIVITIQDFQQLSLIFQKNENWTLPRLKNVLTAYLAKDENQQEFIQKRFESFFMENDLDDGQHTPEPSITPIIEPQSNCKLILLNKYLIWFIIILLGLGLFFFVHLWTMEEKVQQKKTVTTVKPGEPGKHPNKLLQKPNLQNIPLKSLTISPQQLDFGTKYINSINKKNFEIMNNGRTSLLINKIFMSGISESFNSFTNNFALPLDVNEKLIIPVTFSPKKTGTHSGRIEIFYDTPSVKKNILLSGMGRALEKKRLYTNMPVVTSVDYEPVPQGIRWKKYACICVLLLSLILILLLYIYRLKRGPKDKAASFDLNEPIYYNPGVIGGKTQAWLDEETIAFLADSMGYFKSDYSGHRINIASSMKATIKLGGIPTCEYDRRKMIRTLIILEDQYAEAIHWNPVSRELSKGMIRHGIPTIYGKFRGSPEKFVNQAGSLCFLNDFSDYRHGILLFVFTDGKVFQNLKNQFFLETIAHWPMLAWMELRGERFWDESTKIAQKNKIPVFPANKNGIVDAITYFLTEKGPNLKEVSISGCLPVYSSYVPESTISNLLGETLNWAQDCSIIQPVTPELAHKIRQHFYPELSENQIECLYALPNTIVTGSGLKFSNNILKILCQGYYRRRKPHEQKELVDFILSQLDKAKPHDVPMNSLAYLSWEAINERLKLTIKDGYRLKRFGELLQTPLGLSIADQLEHYGFTDNKIPLPKPEKIFAQHRLSNVPGNPLKISFSTTQNISWKYFVLLWILVVMFLINAGWTIKCMVIPEAVKPNVDIIGIQNVPATLEMLKDNGWKQKQDVKKISQFSKQYIKDNTTYRMSLFHNGYYSETIFDTKEQQRTQITIDNKDVKRDCIEKYPNLHMTVRCCTDNYMNKSMAPAEIKTWKERLGRNIPKNRLMSVGLNFVKENENNSELIYFQNTLLQTNSIDLLYSIHTQNMEEQRLALNKIIADIGPNIENTQLIIWDSEISPKIFPELNQIKFGRILYLGSGISWIRDIKKVFETGKTEVVKENEILKALGKVQNNPSGEHAVLVRPVNFTIKEPYDSFENSFGARYSSKMNFYATLNKFKLYKISTQNKNQQMEKIWDDPSSYKYIYNPIDFSPDEHYFAFVHEPDERNISILSLDKNNFRVIQTLKDHLSAITSIRFSPDGSYLISGSIDNTINVYQISSGILKKSQTLERHSDEVYSVDFSGDSSIIASASRDKTINIWRRSQYGYYIHKQCLQKHSDIVRSVSFCQNAFLLASGGNDRTINIWQYAFDKFYHTQTLSIDYGKVTSVDFSPDGRFLASGHEYNMIIIWENISGNFSNHFTQRALIKQERSVYNLSFSPDGKYLTSGHGHSVRKVNIWNFTELIHKR